jgi:hypothetical protein
VNLVTRVDGSVHLKTWAVRVAGGTLHVLLINKGMRPVRVDLQLPGARPATVQRLLAPSVRSPSGVTLDGQQLGTNADWLGRQTTEMITPTVRGYELTVGPASAALLMVPRQAAGI